VGVWISCPDAITPGAVQLNFPSGGCLINGNAADSYVFSGYQYNWISVYQPPSNSCGVALGGASNTAFIGLFYAPSSPASITSPFTFEAPAVGGFMAGTIGFSGTMPAITFSATYAPVAPASRLTS
jgi:hypothetical protein